MKEEKSTTESTQGEPKPPWIECPEVWKTQAAYFSWLRGQMRRAWLRHPVKIKFTHINRFKAPLGKKGPANPKGKMVWAAVCACCSDTYPTSKLQVDHIHSAGSFKGWDDFETWMKGLMHINVEGLQFMCKECHDIKTYADRWNMTIEEAGIAKQVIAFGKLKIDVQLDVLSTHYDTLFGINNATQRKAAYKLAITSKG